MNPSFQIGRLTVPHRLILAPMCGITHLPFRQICKSYGAGLVMTQMVSAKALTMRDPKSLKLLEFKEEERPVGFQIFGNDPDVLAEGAKVAQDLGPDLIDLNMGCPAKKIVNDGGGSALLKDSLLAARVFQKMRAVLHVPFTVKMRAGWDQNQGASLEIARIAQESGLDAVALHARTRAQGYSGRADWDLIREFKETLSIPVLGNGDVETFDDARRMLGQTGCDGVMVGRAPVSRPWLFKEFLQSRGHELTLAEISDLILRQYEAFFSYYGTPGGIKQMRKFLCTYTKGLRNGSEFRDAMVRMDDWEGVKNKILDFFKPEPPREA